MVALLEIFKPYDAQMVSFALTLLTAIVLWIIQARVKLRWGFQHGFSHRLDPAPTKDSSQNPPPIMVRTASYLIANEGRKTATNVEITFNYRPSNYSIWPQRNYETVPNPEGRLIFRFGSISPKELLTINLINIDAENPNLLSMRSDEATGKEIPIFFVRKYPRYVYFFLVYLLAVGFFSSIYAAVSLII